MLSQLEQFWLLLQEWVYLDSGKENARFCFAATRLLMNALISCKSLRWGMAIGIYVAGAIGLWYLKQVDWDYEAKKTLKRLSTTVSTAVCGEDH